MSWRTPVKRGLLFNTIIFKSNFWTYFSWVTEEAGALVRMQNWDVVAVMSFWTPVKRGWLFNTIIFKSNFWTYFSWVTEESGALVWMKKWDVVAVMSFWTPVQRGWLYNTIILKAISGLASLVSLNSLVTMSGNSTRLHLSWLTCKISLAQIDEGRIESTIDLRCFWTCRNKILLSRSVFQPNYIWADSPARSPWSRSTRVA